MAQAEFSHFKQLLKQLYIAHSSKVKELENENKILKEKLAEKERESNASLIECKRCVEFEEAFKKYKKAFHDQSKFFESFGQKFSIFNTPGFENQASKSAQKLSNDSPEEPNHSKKLENDALILEDIESTPFSLDTIGNTITEIKVNAIDKVPVISNKSLFKKVMPDEENLESFDLCTVTFPQHLKHGSHSAKFDSLVLAPDSLDTSFEDKKVLAKLSNENHFRDCSNKTVIKSDENQKLIDNKLKDDKGAGKRLSSDFLNDDRIKRCNTGKQNENVKNNESNSTVSKTKNGKDCSSIPPKTVAQEAFNVFSQVEKKNLSIAKDVNNALDNSVSKTKNETNKTVGNKNETLKNLNILNIVNKSPECETSPSLLLKNANALPKIIHLDDISNDNDDFQEQIPSTKNVQNDDSWDACDKKKSTKKRIMKTIKTTSKFKMTLDTPPINYKKPSFKQTKLSKSIFQPKNTSNKKSPNRLSEVENINPVVIIEDSPTPDDDYRPPTPYNALKSPSAIDIDATFVPEDFNLENKQCMTTSVKKNAVEKSHLKNGSLFSNISFPEELASEDLIANVNENGDHSHDKDAEVKGNMDSFDKLPLPEEPAYKYKNDVVRKKCERRQLNGFDCKECEKYYSELGLSDKEKKERMKKCSRHRGKFTPPSTPDHFWELEFPDTLECKARGYLDKTQKVKLNEICKL